MALCSACGIGAPVEGEERCSACVKFNWSAKDFEGSRPTPGPIGPTERDVVEDVVDATPDELIVPPPTDPVAVARVFLEAHHGGDGENCTLIHHRNTYHVYDGRAWPELDDGRLRADLYRWLGPALYWHKPKRSKTMSLEPFEPTRKKVGDLVEAVGALVHLDAHVTPPAWLDGRDISVVPVSNGLLNIETREMILHQRDFFSPHCLPFEYDPAAPPPERWLQFLDELWGADEESKLALAEVMGYVLGGGTEQQKMFLLVGPKRSGKGTIGRVLTGLLGAHHVAAPTLASLTTNFGLQPLIGKPLALISDARLSTRSDSLIAVERLLSISGEDSLTIDRKYRDPWTGRLSTRFLIMTNEIPRFTDSSGALASRFVVLVLTTSFYGREDPGLTDALLAEAPGIFNWCLDGLDRVRSRGRFEPPETARDALKRLEDLSSPVGAFARDRCRIGPAYEVDKDDLWEAWKTWCTDQGRDRSGTKAVFARDLLAAYPGITEARPSRDGVRVHVYQGIDLAPSGWEEQWTGPLTTPDGKTAVRDAVQPGATENRRSEGSVRDGQGSSPLYSPPDPWMALAQEMYGSERNLFEIARTLRAAGHIQADGRNIYASDVALALGVAV